MTFEVIQFDVTKFRLQFPEFANPLEFRDETLQMYWDMSVCYISDLDYGWLNGNCRQLALNFLTAHLTFLSTLTAQGEMGGVVQGAAIDKVSVTLTPPPIKTQFDYWLNQTSYGQSLASLLEINSSGGFYIPGPIPYVC